MSLLNTTRTRKFVLIAVLAAFATQAGATGTSPPPVDTQTKVGAVLSGARADLTVAGPTGSDLSTRVADVQESTQQVLLGINSSVADSYHANTADPSARPSIGRNGNSNGDAQKLTQAIILGRASW